MNLFDKILKALFYEDGKLDWDLWWMVEMGLYMRTLDCTRVFENGELVALMVLNPLGHYHRITY